MTVLHITLRWSCFWWTASNHRLWLILVTQYSCHAVGWWTRSRREPTQGNIHCCTGWLSPGSLPLQTGETGIKHSLYVRRLSRQLGNTRWVLYSCSRARLNKAQRRKRFVWFAHRILERRTCEREWETGLHFTERRRRGNVQVRSFSLLFSVMTCRCFHCRVTVFITMWQGWFVKFGLFPSLSMDLSYIFSSFHRNVV